MKKQLNRAMFKSLESQDVFPTIEKKSLTELTGLETLRSKEFAILSNNKIVNVVSPTYAVLRNEDYFLQVEEKLINADIKYKTRSINIDNRQFAVDYILEDDSIYIDTKLDKISPMIRFTNSYDSGCKTSGYFGFYREICSNSLNIAETNVGFSVKHKGELAQFVLPQIDILIENFMNNEYYTLKRKFEVMQERTMTFEEVKEFVKVTAEHFDLFNFETSEKNDSPSRYAIEVLDTIGRESSQLGVEPNLWIGYNAFNEYVHNGNSRNFDAKKKIDAQIFDFVLENI